MALLALLSRDGQVEGVVRRSLDGRHDVVRLGAWERFLAALRERPVTAVVVDDALIPGRCRPGGAVAELRRRFPSLCVVWLARPEAGPVHLLQLGRAGVGHLLVAPLDEVGGGVAECVGRALGRGTEALVTRAVSPYLPPRELGTLRLALDGVHRRLSAEELARLMGLSRPHLSVGLREAGLPSAGHLLVWARLLHAGRWLADPGRSGESVSRQLDYANGATFRRALRRYVGATPTQIAAGGGLQLVLDRFIRCCGLGRPDRGRSAA